MAVLTTLAVVLAAWCAASLMTAALYTALRTHQVRRQRALASTGPCAVAGRCGARGITRGSRGARANAPDAW